ncbi:MAG TPA: DUF790 family protein [Ktedonobacterales bacterium]
MRLALADIPKRFSRGEDTVSVAPRLLRLREARESLMALIGHYEASLGRTRADFTQDRSAQIMGDIRIARCLTVCLTEWYAWAAQPWPGPASPDETAALARLNVDSPGALRLALYDHVGAEHGGFVAAAERDAAVASFAARISLTRMALDALLALDDPRASRLTRLSDSPPTPVDLVTRYNQLAVESLLFHAAEVIWRIAPNDGARAGETVKRVCFLARRMGVSYEVTLDVATSTPALLVAERHAPYAAPTTLERARVPIIITFHGPPAMVGAPQQYGDRLARLCRALLGYRREVPADAALGDVGGLSGVAKLHLRGRACDFMLDERLARRLRLSEAEKPDREDDHRGAPAFDSSLERRLFDDFTALERAGESAGWKLEREPEPVLLGDTILVPDFALTRESRRVYLEVAGYWRPDYRARKARKLATLAGAVALIVAAPRAAQAEFAGLDASYPFIWYRNESISAAAIVAIIQRAFDDFPARLAALDLRALLEETERRAVIPSFEASAALHTFTRAERDQAVAALASYATSQNVSAPEWLDGVGLCAAAQFGRLVTQTRAVVDSAGGRLALSAIGPALNFGEESWPEAVVEALARRAGLQIERASLFAADAVIPDAISTPGDAPRTDVQPKPMTPRQARKPQPRKVAPRRHSGARWSTGDLFFDSSTTSDDAAE